MSAYAKLVSNSNVRLSKLFLDGSIDIKSFAWNYDTSMKLYENILRDGDVIDCLDSTAYAFIMKYLTLTERYSSYIVDSEFAEENIERFASARDLAFYRMIRSVDIAIECLTEDEVSAEEMKEKFRWLYDEGLDALIFDGADWILQFGVDDME